MTPWTTGFVATCNAILTGNLEVKLNDISHNEGSTSETFGGAVSALLTCYRALIAAGFSVASDDPGLDSFLKADPASQIIAVRRFLSAGDGKALSAMANVVHSCRMFISFKAPQPVQAGPTQVQIIAMPKRERVTAVTRDQDGNIQQATQIERDAGTPTTGHTTSLAH